MLRFCISFLFAVSLTYAFAAFASADDPRRPWVESRRVLRPGSVVALRDMPMLGWKSRSPEGSSSIDGDTLVWRVKVDHRNESAYPVGWPSFDVRPAPHLDFSRAGALAFQFRATRDIGRPQSVAFVLKHGSDMLRVPVVVENVGVWQDVVVELGSRPWLNDIDLVHFFISESDYRHGDELCFEVRDFRLGEQQVQKVPLARGQAGATLWLGERGDAGSQLVMAREGDRMLPFVLHVDNCLDKALPASAEVAFRFCNVFTGRMTWRVVSLGTAVPPGDMARIVGSVDINGLPGSYYHVLADIRIDGRSVLGICMGSDDLYIARSGESMAYSVLSFRAGLAFWARDARHGGFMHMVDVALPHAYDPLDRSPDAYRAFLRRFAQNTCKVSEGYEAGMPGLALAAEAFLKAGDDERRRFVERMLWGSCMAMLSMQDDCGGVVTQVNELKDEGVGLGWSGEARNNSYSCDQTAEWMRGLAYAALYYIKRGGEREKVGRLNSACLKSARFLLRHARDESGVLRNFIVTLRPDGSVTRRPFVEDGRACDVYQPRVLAGLSFVALALMESGERVPDEWWGVIADTARWMSAKMDDDGWFDNTCPDTKQKPCCHTFLGNIYAGEGLFGAGLAAVRAGKAEESAFAWRAAHRAYRYVTDKCTYIGVRYTPPLEFWVGPYLYWLFDAWKDYVGVDGVFDEWVAVMDRGWRVERSWGDFLRTPGPKVERASRNGMLEISILGYLGILQMKEAGSPWRLLPEKR